MERVVESTNGWVYTYDDYNNRNIMEQNVILTTNYEYDKITGYNDKLIKKGVSHIHMMGLIRKQGWKKEKNHTHILITVTAQGQQKS